MPRYRTVIASTLAPEAAFDYMARFENITEWDPSAVESVPSPAGASPAVGVEYDVAVRFRKGVQRLRYRITEIDAPRRVVLVGTAKSYEVRDEIGVEPDGDGSRVTYDAEIRLRGLMKLAAPLVQRAFNRAGDDAAAGMRRVLNP